MRAGEADALDAVHLVNGFQQTGKIALRIVGRLVVIDDLTEQLHFLQAARGGVADLRQNLALRPHPFVAARVRHDAEAAEPRCSLR